MITSFQQVTKSKPGTFVDTLFRITFIHLFIHAFGYFFQSIDFFFNCKHLLCQALNAGLIAMKKMDKVP